MSTVCWILRAWTWASFITLALLMPGAPGVTSEGPTSVTQTRVREAYDTLPLAFEANQGQTEGQVQFLARRQGLSLFLTPTEAVLVLPPRPLPGRTREAATRRGEQAPDRSAPPPAPPQTAPTVLRLHFVGANPAPQVSGREQLPGTSNYFLGNDPSAWHTNIPTYARVHYREVYPGIDVVYYGNPRHLEYDILVAPGADPSAITLALTWEGEAGTPGPLPLHVDTDGALVLPTAVGTLRLHPPAVYQERAGVRHAIACQYVLVPVPAGEGESAAGGTAQLRFQVAAYDRRQPLIIDPVVSYSTFLGGSGLDEGTGIAVDGAGQAYVTGNTGSANFPTTPGAVQPTFGGSGDAFVTKFAFVSVAPIPALSPVAQALVVVVLGVSGLLVLRRRLSPSG